SPYTLLRLRPFILSSSGHLRHLHSFPTRRSSDLSPPWPPTGPGYGTRPRPGRKWPSCWRTTQARTPASATPSASTPRPACTPCRSEEHTSELQSRENLVCRLLLEKKKKKQQQIND